MNSAPDRKRYARAGVSARTRRRVKPADAYNRTRITPTVERLFVRWLAARR